MSNLKPFKYTHKPKPPIYSNAWSIGIKDGLVYFGFGILTHEGSDRAYPLGSYVMHVKNAHALFELLKPIVGTKALNKALKASTVEAMGIIQKPRFIE